MFKELAALAQHSPLLLLVSREGEKLRVNLTRKADDDEKTTALSLSILATAEELDAELPLALAEGLAMTDTPAATPGVAEQVKAQVQEAKEPPVITPRVKRMKGEDDKAAPGKRRRARKPRTDKAKEKAPVKASRRARKAAQAISPIPKPDNIEQPPAPKRRRRKGTAMDTPEGGPSAGSGDPTATRAPAPDNGTGAGAADHPQVGEPLPPGETRTPTAPGEPVTGDGSGNPLKPARDGAQARARDTSTLNLFS